MTKTPLHTLNPDKVYCVSLERRTDRRESFTRQAESIGLDFEFWPAVDAQKLKLKGTDRIPAGSIGCWESHLNIYKAALYHNWERVIIFEDDAVFCPGFNDLLSITLPLLPNDWQFTYLGGFEHGGFGSWQEQVNAHWVRPRCLWGTHAYMLQGRHTFEILVDRLRQQTMQLDEMIYNNLQPNRHLLKFYHMLPNGVDQDFKNLGTDIQVHNLKPAP